jgi:hypothetical protein
MAASTLLALYARHRALWTQSWVTLAVVDGLAAVAPIVTLYVIFAGR